MSRASQASINLAASQIGVSPEWLDKQIQAESGWDPTAYNDSAPIGLNPRGLIQFIDSTAQGLGYANSLDLVSSTTDPNNQDSSDVQLLGPVVQYYKKLMPFPNIQSFLMATMFPAYRNVDPLKPFPLYVQAANPGLNTPQDYIDRVMGKGYVDTAIALTPLLFVGAVILYLYFKGRK
jgi:hypothetical protein